MRTALLIVLLLAFVNLAHAAGPAPLRLERDTLWFAGSDLLVEGRAFKDTKDFWNRLPARAEGKVTPAVWGLQTNTAGMAVRFTTDSAKVSAIWSGGGAMRHMPATGVSGLDLYRRVEGGRWQWTATGNPLEKETSTTLVSAAAGPTEYLLFLPLYHRVTKLEIGIDQKAKLTLPGRTAKPIVIYGTSITQGGCASRSGMAHPAILRRWLDREIINLGFSGSGKMEPAMGGFVAEIDAAVYVLDCLPNMSDELAAERLEPFVRDLRKARPEVPIVLVSHIIGPLAGERNRMVKALYEKLLAEGWTRLHFIDGPGAIAGREEGTVDGIHPTDLGFERMAVAFEPVLKSALTE